MVDFLDDLESDFSAIHRVGDIYQLEGARFLKMAWRMSAYQGVMQMRLQEQERQGAGSLAPQPADAPVRRAPQPQSMGSSGGAKVVPLAAFRSAFPGAVEHRKGRAR